ncbi:hypothetical protein BH10PSE16_BH10PSE16_04110 [soil metagenome]
MSSQPKQPAIEKIFQIIAQMTGFVIATLVNFVKTVFKEIVTSEEKLIDEAALKASPMQTAQAVSEGVHSSTVPEAIAIEVAVSHLQMHSGVIRDASTKVIKLSLFAGSNPRIERLLSVPCEKLHFQRINWRFDRIRLSHFTPEKAAKSDLPFNYEGAKKYSLADFDAKAPHGHLSKQVQNFAEIPFLSKGGSPEKVSSQEEQTDNSVTSPTGCVTEAEGTVLSASSVVVAPEGKTEYRSFAVVLSTATGDVTFQGVDLEVQFKKYHYSIGDLVSIKKSSSKFEFTKPNKKSETRTKNVFIITVLKKA